MKKFIAVTGVGVFGWLFMTIALLGAVQAAAAKGSVTAVPEDWHTLLEQAKADVREDMDIANDMNAYIAGVLLRSIERSAPGTNDLESRSGLCSALVEHFVLEETREEIIRLETGEEVTYTEIVYRFETVDEILDKMQNPPYSFPARFVIELRELFSESSQGSSEFTGTYPVPLHGRVTSGYGWRIHPVTGQRDFHTGIDIQGFWHDDILAIADGMVHQVSSDQFYGKFVLVQGDDGMYSFYAHLSRQLVSVGQRVLQGDVIGVEGGEPGLDPNPGLSTGHHLHFGIYTSPERSSHVDPTKYLQR